MQVHPQHNTQVFHPQLNNRSNYGNEINIATAQTTDQFYNPNLKYTTGQNLHRQPEAIHVTSQGSYYDIHNNRAEDGYCDDVVYLDEQPQQKRFSTNLAAPSSVIPQVDDRSTVYDREDFDDVVDVDHFNAAIVLERPGCLQNPLQIVPVDVHGNGFHRDPRFHLAGTAAASRQADEGWLVSDMTLQLNRVLADRSSSNPLAPSRLHNHHQHPHQRKPPASQQSVVVVEEQSKQLLAHAKQFEQEQLARELAEQQIAWLQKQAWQDNDEFDVPVFLSGLPVPAMDGEEQIRQQTSIVELCRFQASTAHQRALYADRQRMLIELGLEQAGLDGQRLEDLHQTENSYGEGELDSKAMRLERNEVARKVAAEKQEEERLERLYLEKYAWARENLLEKKRKLAGKKEQLLQSMRAIEVQRQCVAEEKTRKKEHEQEVMKAEERDKLAVKTRKEKQEEKEKALRKEQKASRKAFLAASAKQKAEEELKKEEEKKQEIEKKRRIKMEGNDKEQEGQGQEGKENIVVSGVEKRKRRLKGPGASEKGAVAITLDSAEEPAAAVLSADKKSSKRATRTNTSPSVERCSEATKMEVTRSKRQRKQEEEEAKVEENRRLKERAEDEKLLDRLFTVEQRLVDCEEELALLQRREHQRQQERESKRRSAEVQDAGLPQCMPETSVVSKETRTVRARLALHAKQRHAASQCLQKAKAEEASRQKRKKEVDLLARPFIEMNNRAAHAHQAMLEAKQKEFKLESRRQAQQQARCARERDVRIVQRPLLVQAQRDYARSAVDPANPAAAARSSRLSAATAMTLSKAKKQVYVSRGHGSRGGRRTVTGGGEGENKGGKHEHVVPPASIYLPGERKALLAKKASIDKAGLGVAAYSRFFTATELFCLGYVVTSRGEVREHDVNGEIDGETVQAFAERTAVLQQTVAATKVTQVAGAAAAAEEKEQEAEEVVLEAGKRSADIILSTPSIPTTKTNVHISSSAAPAAATTTSTAAAPVTLPKMTTEAAKRPVAVVIEAGAAAAVAEEEEEGSEMSEDVDDDRFDY